MPTLIALMMEIILLANLFLLLIRLKRKNLAEEYNIALSAAGLAGIVIVITIALRIISGF